MELPPAEVELSVVMPCLNERNSLAVCIGKAKQFIRDHAESGEIIVADNGSTDGSQELAAELGARVIHVREKGYGCALDGGIRAARGRFVVMGDSDDSYDFSALEPFLVELRRGADLVMGNRFRGGIAPGAMPLLHRYFGNPFLSFVGRTFFRSPCSDFYCGLRAFTREGYQKLNMQAPGMEFALEMLAKATMYGLTVREVPTTLSPDKRGRPPHLRRWRDGWRSLRFFLLFSPKWLFWFPGLALFAIGASAMATLAFGPITVGSVTFNYHTLLAASAATITGFQSACLAVCAKYAALISGVHPRRPHLERLLDSLTLKRGLAIGGGMAVLGVV